jgi:hypothetical protein
VDVRTPERRGRAFQLAETVDANIRTRIVLP